MGIQPVPLWLGDQHQRRHHRARHTVDVNEDFIDIVEKSDLLLAWMSYFEARKGRFSFFTDFVWAGIGFPGHFNITKDPLGRFDRATLNVKGNAQLDYQEMIIQSGVTSPAERTGKLHRFGPDGQRALLEPRRRPIATSDRHA